MEIPQVERLKPSLSELDLEETASRWKLDKLSSDDGILSMVYDLARPVISWVCLRPDIVGKRDGWGKDVSFLIAGAGTVGKALSSVAETEDRRFKALTVALLGRGQERFFRIAESVAGKMGLPVGAFHTPGSAGGLEMSENLNIGKRLPLDVIDVSVLPGGRLSPSYSWIGVIPMGTGADRVSFLCSGCIYYGSCPLRRD